MQNCSLRTLEIANEWSDYCLNSSRRGQRGTPTLFLKLLGGGMEPPIDVPQNFRLYVFSVSHCLYWFLCCVYNSKFTIIITLKVAYYFVSICSNIEST